MKKPYPKNRWSQRLCLGLVSGAVLLGSLTNTQAQSVSTSITNRFDTANSATGWTYWYDMYNGQYNSIILDWDGAVNNGGVAGSGSVVYTNLWKGVNSGAQAQIWGTFAHTGASQYDQSQTIDGTKYDTISFDVHVNANAPTNANGDICRLNVGFWTQNYQVHGATDVNIPTSATNGWYHVVANVNKTDPGLSSFAAGWALNINCYGGPNQILQASTTPTYLWIDNIQANRSKTVNPPPTLSTTIADAPPGLNLYLGNGQYERTGIKTFVDTGKGWVGQPDTTYAFTIDRFPSAAAYPNNQAHIFIATPDGASSIDYNTTNLVWLNVQGNVDGTATAYFRYKIFEDHSNSNMFGGEYTNGAPGVVDVTNRTSWAGQLAGLTAPTAVGRWSMTFNQDTNVTLTGPGGVTTNFSMNPLIPTFFTDPLAVVFGAQPNNNPPASGQSVVVSRASITNTTGVVLDDDFLADNGVLDSATWTISAGAAVNVQLFPPDVGQKLVKWSLPDTSFGLQISTNLAKPNSWTTLSGSEAGSPIPTFTSGASKVGVVPSANLSSSQNYFRLFTRKFTKLQVLMPGEAADPGSVTGKTGTPDPQAVGVPFNVTVNAVDANWYPAAYASDHSVHLTCTDGTATLPADTDMAGGTVTLSVTLNQVTPAPPFNFTVTASDVTDPTKTANTGSSTSVP